MWKYNEDQLNELRKLAYEFPGVGSISELTSGTTQLKQILVDYCIFHSFR
jgi:hypothetical protein